jgi:hypothetical protein
MTRTVKITSKREFLYNTPEEVVRGRYQYLPASKAVKVITAAALEFNAQNSTETVNVSTKATEDEKAKVKLKGKKQAIEHFLNRLLAETELLYHFDIKC